MPAAPAASIVDFILGLALGRTEQDANNRFALEGLTLGATKDGTLEIGVRKLEAAALRLASGPRVLELGKLALHALAAQVRVEEGRPRLVALQAASAELSGVKVQAPLVLSQQAAAPALTGAWSLAPLASADGAINAQIVDATLLFDADVMVPIRQGLVDFNEATVEHVGPDSRMGVSRLGIYVDAPNGRSYLYQFSSAPVAGVEFERRSALPGPWGTRRGSLRLQEFAEGMLRQAPAANLSGITEQSRQLFDRTSVKGHLQLGDGRFAAPGVQADVIGRAQGRNLVRLHSQAVGREITAEMATLSVRNAVAKWRGMQVRCDEVAGAVTLRVFAEGRELRFAFGVGELKVTGVRVDLERGSE